MWYKRRTETKKSPRSTRLDSLERTLCSSNAQRWSRGSEEEGSGRNLSRSWSVREERNGFSHVSKRLSTIVCAWRVQWDLSCFKTFIYYSQCELTGGVTDPSTTTHTEDGGAGQGLSRPSRRIDKKGFFSLANPKYSGYYLKSSKFESSVRNKPLKTPLQKQNG